MMRIVSYLVLLLMTGVMFITTSGLPELYNAKSAPATHVSPHYIENSKEETGSPNFVTAVLADYRGYDTLGETTVIFTAGIATVLLLRTSKGKEEKDSKKACLEEGKE
ncbi:MAG: hypothetical protein PHI90_01090 [Clostridia bacterium]|nr:hypothetical protein [Clostridia bacterium]MDD4047419.1 hypothetical protein [Clostridia bacterium]